MVAHPPFRQAAVQARPALVDVDPTRGFCTLTHPLHSPPDLFRVKWYRFYGIALVRSASLEVPG